MGLLGYRRVLLVAIAIAIPFHTQAQDRSIGPRDGAVNVPPGTAQHAVLADGRPIGTYDNWAIRQLKDDKTYILVGEATGPQHGHLWFHCNRDGLLTVAVPMLEKAKRHKLLRSQIVGVKSDDAEQRELSLTVFESFVAVAMDFDKSRDQRVAAFVDGLGSARKTFAVSYDSTTLEFGVRQFPAASSRFFELCNRMARK